MIELYEFAPSGNCYKVRLMLGMLGLDYASIQVNGGSGEHKQTGFLAMNPFGQVPVLKDGDAVIRDSQAILVYLASHYGGEQWWPNSPTALAHIAAWLSTAANEVDRGLKSLRKHFKFGRSISVEEAQQISRTTLGIMDERLAAHDWIATDRPSIADIALYPYTALAPEGRVDLSPYPAVVSWLRRIQALPGYVGMPGI